nr:polysaccharide deacetylase family protein [Butyricicoccus pullicaecorum]
MFYLLCSLSKRKRKKIWTVLGAVALVLMLAGAGTAYDKWFGPVTTVNAEVTNWGLSFPTPGQPPVGNASSEELEALSARYLGDVSEPVIYLTFDAGFENGNTPAILDALKKHHAPAAFFLVGNYLETAPDLVRRMVEEGHVVGNHTTSHPDMSKIADLETFQQELKGVEDLYREVTGQEMPKLYRPPQGKFSLENLKQAQQLGYTTVFWSLAYVDWYTDNQPTKEQAFDKLLPRIHNGAIVLLHSTSSTNAQILDELLTKWEQAGYRFGNLKELMIETAPSS